MLATADFLAHNFPAAQRRYEEALAVARELGDQRVVAMTLMNFGRFERDNDEPVRSRALLEESLAISRATGNEVDVAWAVKELAQNATYEGAYEQAREYAEEGFEIAGRLGLAVVLGDLVFSVALLASRTGREQEGARLLGAVITQDDRLGYEHTPELTSWWALHDGLRSALGESEFESALAEGRALELDAAVARARAFLDEGPG